MPYKPVMLMILDGWGIRTMEHANAVVLGNTPNYDRWSKTLERSVLDASGEAVGLVPEQMGNSEVGHLNLGAGRVVYQDIARIDKDIREGAFFNSEMLIAAMGSAVQEGHKVHIMGLLGPGGVHAHETHHFALVQLAHKQGISPILHIITDGRDTPPESGFGYLQNLEKFMAKNGIEARIATVSGRYYAMDRDHRWERTAKAYQAMVEGTGKSAPTADEAIRQSYAEGVTDEFILPTVIQNADDVRIADGDLIICYNFRADRMRQIVKLLAVSEFEGRPDVYPLKNPTIITFTMYDEELPVQVLFSMQVVTNPLAEVISKAGMKQFHIAETEKYPHVTYFFNGRCEEPFAGEERTIVPSPKVATYDLQPEMSAPQVAETILKRIREQDDDFLLINFANPDMVGHTGSLEAAIKAVETVDFLAGQIVDAIVEKGGVALVTADHGNCERMVDEITGEPHTYHTTAPVPFFIIGQDFFMPRLRGILADVAPTILDLLGLERPEEMTGHSLVDSVRKHE